MPLHKIRIQFIFLYVFQLFSLCITGQEDYLIGSRLFVSPGTVNLVNIGNDQITSIGSINGVTGYLGGDCTFDKNNNRYFINTSEGIKVINATNGSIISTIPNQEPNGFLITSIEYNPNNDRLIGVYASGNPDIIKSVNISTGIISNLSTIPDFGNYNSGDCTFDVANNRYFINTSSGIKVINGSNGSLISTINDQDMVSNIEYNPNNGKLIGIYTVGSPEIVKSVNITTGEISNLGTIPEFGGYPNGDCTFDDETERYFIGTSTDIYVINALNGSVIKTIENVEGVRLLEYNTSLSSNPTELDITSTIIPPWQREGDSYQGSVTVSTSPTGSTWHLQVKVSNSSNGNLITTINYPSISNSTQNFFSSDPQLSLNSIKGRTLTFYAILDEDDSSQQAGTTNIIEKKWENKNVVLYNDESTVLLKIPIRYNAPSPATHIKISRNGNVARSTLLSIPGLGVPPPIENNSGNSIFQIGSDGYVTINVSNSTLESVFAGDFKVEVYVAGFVNEVMNFDLTKFGKIFIPNQSYSKVAIVIGGIFNEIESSANNLDANPTNSDLSFSVLKSLYDNGFNIWYISQGNANSMKRNGYDIGVALDSILQRNLTITEFDFVCHSKGGLDTRAFLAGFTKSYNGILQNSYITSNAFGKIKKVLFLGTPHHGANLASLGLPFSALLNCPGAQELTTWTGVLGQLNNLSMPFDIDYANLAGYRATINQAGFNGYNLAYSDGIVSVNSNNYFTELFSSNRVKQLFQHSFAPPFLTHFLLHKKNYLSFTNVYLDNLSCLYPTSFPTNISKIIAFFTGNPPYDPTTPFQTCPEPEQSQIIISLSGSIVSNASVFIKPASFGEYYLAGMTDDLGTLNTQIIPGLLPGDSIYISAEGFEDVKFTVDSLIISNGKIPVPMFKKAVPNNKINTPIFTILDSYPVTNKDSVNLSITAINANSFEINSPVNQDTAFIPLFLNNNQFGLKLNEGINRIVIKISGAIDTIIYAKNIFYIPDSLNNELTYNLYFSSDSSKLHTAIYLNNEFYKTIDRVKDTILLPRGVNTISLIYHGVKDTLLVVDTANEIVLTEELTEYSYHLPGDSIIANFILNGSIHYSRTISILDSSRLNIISISQFEDEFQDLSLKPLSRVFKFTHLNTSSSCLLKAAIILDQEDYIALDKSYLLEIIDDTIFNKISLIENPLIANYDPVSQKLDFNELDFNSCSTQNTKLVIMERKSLVPLASSEIEIQAGDSIAIPISAIFVDPDSITNDIQLEILSLPTELTSRFNSNFLFIKSSICKAGFYTVNLKGKHDELSALNTLNIKILPPIIPQISPIGELEFCEGDSVILEANSASVYLWNTGETNQSIIATLSGDYYVEITDSLGCSQNSDTLHVTVLESPIPEISIQGEDKICFGDSVLLSTAPFNSYQWSTGEMSQNIIVQSSGEYGVTVEDHNGCIGDSDPITITVFDLPIVDLGLDTVVMSSYALDAGNTGSTYEWNTGETTQTILVDSTGWYSVTVTDAQGCKSFDSVYVEILTSIISLNETNQVKIYPNPNNGIFTLSGEFPISELLQIKVIDPLGNNIFSSDSEMVSGRFEKTIDLDKPVSGMYFLILSIGTKSYSGKLMIQPY